MYCDKCGSPVRDGARFCPVCGESVAVTPQAPVADTDTVPPAPQAYLQQVSPEPARAQVPEPPAMFASKRLGIALIVTSIVWLLLHAAISFIAYSLFLIQAVSTGVALLLAIVLVAGGIQEIRWSKETRAGGSMAGFADIVLAVSLLLLGIGYSPLELSSIILRDFGYLSGFQVFLEEFAAPPGNILTFSILGLVAMVIAAVLFILVAINRKKAGQRISALGAAILLLIVFALLNILPSTGLVTPLFGWRMAMLTVGTLVNAFLLAALIARAVDLFPQRSRAVQPVGVPVGGSTAAGNPLDAPSGGFAVLCFFVPLVGLILYLVWKSEYPLKARSCGKGAIIGAIVGFVLSCLSVVLVTVLPLLLMF
jgi:hypothetical protein